MEKGQGENRLQANSIGLAHIVFFVVAAAAPMTAVVGATPPAFAFGNGAGVPGAFILAGILYLIFSAGFTAMTRHVPRAGAFYTYITRGLGSPAGLGGALTALLAYFAIQIAVFALFAVFVSGFAASLGLDLPWWVWAFAGLAAVVLLGRRHISVSGHILGVCMIAELVILLVLDIAILAHGGGPDGISAAGFRPSDVLVPGLGVTMVFVLGSYVGFEATAIFGEEASNPDRTIPRATYTAVILITAFYAFSTWSIVQYYGPENAQAAAAASLEGFYFNAMEALLGGWVVKLAYILLITSLFACLLSFHNTLNRYLYALGHEGLIWAHVAKVHQDHGSPHVAGLVQAALVVSILGLFALFGADPYGVVFSWMSALAVLSIVAVQTMVSTAVIAFFRRDSFGRSPLVTLVAPALATAGLAAAFCLVWSNLPMLTGSENPAVRAFPVIVLGTAASGWLLALRIKRLQPEIYARLGQAFD
ncbi:APC family permease [Rhodovulum sulfidophilum]|uniref:APC family permease n=1 Tax=Rhodovulum sulfidophilum TaxID=35806 RepID=UPI0019289413|nr:APC family permease [Rhodovulum sulfidophilum]MBL3587203.1 APC family permease [Rhodovulum sulfidophilum]